MDVIRPQDERYNDVSGTFVHPGAPEYVVMARDAEDVAKALEQAAAEGLKVTVRSGGHSSAGLSTNVGGVVIDLSAIDQVEVDGDLVSIGSGARWGEVAAKLRPHGLVISSGDTAGVGVGGLMLGGGIGWMVRKYGLALDHLVAAELVTADGVVHQVSETDEPDLFWAVRGGGGTVGVVTTFVVRARRERLVTFAKITYPVDVDVLRNWRDLLRVAPDDLTTTAQIYPAFGPDAPATLVILACYAGDDPAAVEPLLRLGAVVDKEIQVTEYADVLADASQLPDGWRPMLRNRFVSDISDALLDELLERRAGIPMMFVELRGLGGAMSRVAVEATAFAHRDAEGMLTTVVLGSPEDHVPVRAAFEEMWDAFAPYTKGAYSNFLSEVRAADVAAAYPDATFARLARIKAEHDPGNVFTSVPAAAARPL